LPSRDELLGVPGLHWHDYGKAPRPGRKIGHCTVVAASAVERDRLVRKVLKRLPR
jgi:5-(carboxyamino)imidazole ribonucleotide synthase